MERKYLSGNIRERLQDLMKELKITQSELAAKIEIDVSTLCRFISNATGKLSDENIKKIGSNVSDAQAMSKEAAQQMYAELTKGQDVTKPNVTPEMIVGAITGSVSGMDGVDPEALKQFNQALIGLLTVKPTEDEHNGS